MEIRVERDRPEDISAVALECAAIVVNGDAGQLLRDPVGNDRSGTF